MERKLPKVFANEISKDINNNERVHYSSNNDNLTRGINKEQDIKEHKNIYQKINDIFNSERYVYKAEVNIKTKNGNIKTKVIGQNRTHLITYENELIPITDIEDIEFIK